MPRPAPLRRAVRRKLHSRPLRWPVLRSVAGGGVGRIGQIGPRDNPHSPTVVAVQPPPHFDEVAAALPIVHKLSRKPESGAFSLVPRIPIKVFASRTEVDAGMVPSGFRHGLRFTALTVRVDRVRQ